MKRLLFVCDGCAPKHAEALTVGLLNERECCVCHMRFAPGSGNLFRAEELARHGVHPTPITVDGTIQ